MTLFIPETFTPVEHFSRDVQISREEFLRQLPGAIDGRPFMVRGDVVAIAAGGGRVLISMTDLGLRQVGPMDLPMLRLDFAFDGLSPQEMDSFMDEYDRRTLRGAGGM